MRFASALVGYLAAVFAASGFIHVAFLGPLGWGSEDVPGLVAGTLVFSVPFVALLVAYTALVPSVLAILVLEYLGWRDWFSTLMAGAAIAVTVVGMLWTAMPDDRLGEWVLQSGFVALTLGAGLAGGLAYWLVTGMLRAAISPAR